MNRGVATARALARLAGFVGATAAARIRLPSTSASPAVCEANSQWLGKTLVELCGLQIERDGPAPPPGVILVANHRSYADTAVLASLLPCTFVAKWEVADWPVAGAWLRAVGTIFVRRGDFWTGARALQAIRERVRGGRTVVVFPEGTTAGGAILPFRAGVFRLAAMDGHSVVPVAVEYERETDAWTDPDDRTFVPHFIACFGRRVVRIRVRFGPVMRDGNGDVLRARAHGWIAANLRRPGEFRADDDGIRPRNGALDDAA